MLDQVIRSLTCWYLEILLVVIRLGETGLKKTRFVLPGLVLGKGEKGRCDVVCVERL